MLGTVSYGWRNRLQMAPSMRPVVSPSRRTCPRRGCRSRPAGVNLQASHLLCRLSAHGRMAVRTAVGWGRRCHGGGNRAGHQARAWRRRPGACGSPGARAWCRPPARGFPAGPGSRAQRAGPGRARPERRIARAEPEPASAAAPALRIAPVPSQRLSCPRRARRRRGDSSGAGNSHPVGIVCRVARIRSRAAARADGPRAAGTPLRPGLQRRPGAHRFAGGRGRAGSARLGVHGRLEHRLRTRSLFARHAAGEGAARARADSRCPANGRGRPSRAVRPGRE